jgi:tRNA pseudouridine55 synthase
MATGLLLIGVGRATRLLRFLGDLPKTYAGTLRLGVVTDTLDADGDVIRESAVDVTEEQVAEAMRSLVGESFQRPPAYSAVKVGGRKLYEAARAGEQLEVEPRPIRVDGFDLLSFDPPDVTFRVICSGGTYVRVLAADVGAAVSTGAHLTALRRTAIGPHRAQDAISPDAVSEPLAIEAAVGHLPRLGLEADEAEAASHGRPLGPAGIEGPYGVFGPDGRLIGVYEDDGPRARPQVIVAG